MNITQIAGTAELGSVAPQPTEEELQREYNYMLAKELTEKLLATGLITENEFEKVMAKNQKSFQPLIGRILQK